MLRLINYCLSGTLLLLVACSGCAQSETYPQGTVVGTVTVDGAPAPRGAITFSPAAGRQGPVTGATIKDGRFRCEHLPLGSATVTFVLHAAELSKFTDVTGVVRDVPQSILPAAYRAGVPVEVQVGENVRDFPLLTRPDS